MARSNDTGMNVRSRDVVFQKAVEEAVVNDPRGGGIEEGIPIVRFGWARLLE
jgi:hypothetical protein